MPTRCWLWRASLTKGYGTFVLSGPKPAKKARAHRYAYELLVGKIPDGLGLDHLCRRTECVRPSHMEPCTQKVNVLRGRGLTAKNARKKQCPQGHKYSASNTYKDRRGSRCCRKCKREKDKKRRYKL